jgi:Methyltransferase domain/C-methyltransferase C-terminal domain
MEIHRPPEPNCLVCGSDATFEFLRRPSVPVHQNLLLDNSAAARDLTRGDLAMRLCERCGFGFNAAFRPDLLDYGRNYDNTQNWSPAFDRYVDELVRDLVEIHGVRRCRVVEVGCGKGTFLKKLIAYPGADNVGHGFDPSYIGPDVELGGRLRFTRSFFSGAAAEPADVVVCRHVIEHVREPLELLRAIRSGRAARVFFETPCLEWILRHQVTWDFFYEHCSLFTPQSLATALTRSGFADIQVRHVFAGQYLWVQARGDQDGISAQLPLSGTSGLARAFSLREQGLLHSWRQLVTRWAGSGDVAVWGAGAKGVTFCNLVDPHCALLSCVIDANPAKHGKYVAGTGHPIVGPERLLTEDVAAVLVLNPMYTEEIVQHLNRLGSRAVLVDAMRARGDKACA